MKRLLACLILANSTATALAGSTGEARMEMQRHRTGDVLDRAEAVTDDYWLLRGSFARNVALDGAVLGLSADFEASRHDEWAIEDDRKAGLAATVSGKPADHVELRGTIALGLASEGDDLIVGPFVIGTRTNSASLAAKGEMGIALDAATTLTLEAGLVAERYGRTHFQAGAIEPLRLEPDRDTVQLGARWTRTIGRFSVGGSMAARLFDVAAAEGIETRIGHAEQTLRLEGAWDGGGALRIGAAGGLQRLAPETGSTALRPAWHLVVERRLGKLALRGTALARFDIADSDDPVADWMRRVELVAAWPAAERLVLEAGAYREFRTALSTQLETDERAVFVEARYALDPAMTVVFRVDGRRRAADDPDARRRGLDAFIGLRTQL